MRSPRVWMADWIRRRQGDDVPPVTLHRRRLYILPTKTGIGFAFLLFFMLIAGLNYINSLALFFTFLLAGFAFVAMIQCHRNLLGLTLVAVDAAPAFAGTAAQVRFRVQNDAARERYDVFVELSDAAYGSADVPAHGACDIELAVPTSARGRLRFTRARIGSTHPFGLFRAWTWAHLPIEVIAYPQPVGTLTMPASPGTQGRALPRTGADPDEWLGLRPFRDGDSPRHVAWNAYARGAPLLVKEYGASGEGLRDFSLADLPGIDVETQLRQLARWIVDADANDERYGLAMPSARFPPDRGDGHRRRCLTALALHGEPDERSPAADARA